MAFSLNLCSASVLGRDDSVNESTNDDDCDFLHFKRKSHFEKKKILFRHKKPETGNNDNDLTDGSIYFFAVSSLVHSSVQCNPTSSHLTHRASCSE